MSRPGRSNERCGRLILRVVLAAGLAGTAARVRAASVEAALALEPAVAVVGQEVTAILTVTNTGVDVFTTVTASLSITSGSDAARIASGPNPGTAVDVLPGAAKTFYWTVSATGTGTVRLLGRADGYVLSQPFYVASSAILVIPSPSPPAIRILNNVLRSGTNATIILHGSASGSVTLVVYDQSGAPLGPVGAGPVPLDGNGFGSARFDGTVQGRRLSTGVYWVVASGAASAKAPLLVPSR